MEKCNILIGRFQPMTNGGHLKCAEQAIKRLNVPTLFMMIETKESKLDSKHPFPSSMLLSIYSKALKTNKNVAGIVLVKNANIIELVETCRNNGFEPISWTCGTDRYDAYQKMVDKYAEKIDLDPNFQLLEIKRGDEDSSATKLRNYLRNGDINSFEKDFIPCNNINNVFNKLRTQLLSIKESYMESLHNVIMEFATGAWNIEADWNDVVEKCLSKRSILTPNDIEKIHQYLDVCWNEIGVEEHYKLAANGVSFFKIPRVLEESLYAHYSNGNELIVYDKSTLYAIKNEKRIKIGIIGNGSKDNSLIASEHELCTCAFFNAFVHPDMDIYALNRDIMSNSLDLDDKKSCSAFAKEFLNKNSVSKSWVDTFPAHVKQIIMFLKKSNVNPSDYIAVHMGKGPVGRVYSNFINTYKKSLSTETNTNINRNTIDPSDIIVYKQSEESNIISILTSIKSLSQQEALTKFKEELFFPRLMIGVSLKQTPSMHIPDIYNGWGTENMPDDPLFMSPIIKVSRVEFHEAKRSFELKCAGTFRLGKVSIDDSEDLSKKENYILITLRSNQKEALSGVAMDIKIGNHPLQGKVPVDLWKKYINVDIDSFVSKSNSRASKLKDELMQEYKQVLMDFYGFKKNGDRSSIRNKETSLMISVGIKQFPTCLPYILVN